MPAQNTNRFRIKINPPGKFIKRRLDTSNSEDLCILGKNITCIENVLTRADSPTYCERFEYAEACMKFNSQGGTLEILNASLENQKRLIASPFTASSSAYSDTYRDSMRELAEAVVPFESELRSWHIKKEIPFRGRRSYSIVVKHRKPGRRQTAQETSVELATGDVGLHGYSFDQSRSDTAIHKRASQLFVDSIRAIVEECGGNGGQLGVITARSFLDKIDDELLLAMPGLGSRIEGTRTLYLNWLSKEKNEEMPQDVADSFKRFFPDCIGWSVNVDFPMAGVDDLSRCISEAHRLLDLAGEEVEKVDLRGYKQDRSFQTAMVNRAAAQMRRVSVHKKNIEGLASRLAETHDRMAQVIDNAQGVTANPVSHLFE